MSCPKCDRLYDTLMALLDEMIKYFTNRMKYRNEPKEIPWSEERRKEYNNSRIKALKNRKDFITRYYKEN